MKFIDIVYITDTMKKNIKSTEKRLGLKCNTVIMQQNRLKERIVYGIFGKSKEVITMASYTGNILNSLAFNS